MLLEHIGYNEKAAKLANALDICCVTERRLKMTGRDTGATCGEFAEYVIGEL
jgi:isocitrate dehydrogenase (NAD+)